jgi:hypothetical protein
LLYPRDVHCRACFWSIRLTDEVNRLPILGALVHRRCYEVHTSQLPWISRTLLDDITDTPLTAV